MRSSSIIQSVPLLLAVSLSTAFPAPITVLKRGGCDGDTAKAHAVAVNNNAMDSANCPGQGGPGSSLPGYSAGSTGGGGVHQSNTASGGGSCAGMDGDEYTQCRSRMAASSGREVTQFSTAAGGGDKCAGMTGDALTQCMSTDFTCLGMSGTALADCIKKQTASTQSQYNSLSSGSETSSTGNTMCNSGGANQSNQINGMVQTGPGCISSGNNAASTGGDCSAMQGAAKTACMARAASGGDHNIVTGGGVDQLCTSPNCHNQA